MTINPTHRWLTVKGSKLIADVKDLNVNPLTQSNCGGRGPRNEMRAPWKLGAIIATLATASTLTACSASTKTAAGSTPAVAAPVTGRAASSSTSPSPAVSWAASLGQGVTVVPPPATQPTAGNSTPAAALETVIAAGDVSDLAQLCDAIEPSAQSACNQAFDGLNVTDKTENVKIGYTAITGDEALVAFTGKYCGSPCVTVSEPAAVITPGETFNSLYNQATAAESSSHTYPLYPCIEVNGVWYIYAPASTFNNQGNNAG